jgi:hypothetical protein
VIDHLCIGHNRGIGLVQGHANERNRKQGRDEFLETFHQDDSGFFNELMVVPKRYFTIPAKVSFSCRVCESSRV